MNHSLKSHIYSLSESDLTLKFIFHSLKIEERVDNGVCFKTY